MSLEVSKDEIYLVAPEGKYQNIAASWGAFMEKDFTLYTRAKVLLLDDVDSAHTGNLSQHLTNEEFTGEEEEIYEITSETGLQI
jgi:hypothetical protein